jgi:ubiquinone biosynthesis accessory factor UbiJ
MSSLLEIGVGRLLERAVRQARADSPRAVSLLQSLAGRRLGVQIAGTPWDLTLESTGETLRLVAIGAGRDATIVGGPLALLTLAGPDPQAVISRGDVTITGDAEIAQQFRELAMLLRPDLESGLSHLLGRTGAHVAMRGLRSIADGARERALTLTQNTAEYLAHERRDLVSRAEAEHFLRGVDEMRERLDRLEARLIELDRRVPALRTER